MAAAIADAIRKDGVKVAITGFTDRTGDAAAIQELARNGALAVRDALKAADVAEADLEMQEPVFAEIGAPGSDAEARRVEMTRQ